MTLPVTSANNSPSGPTIRVASPQKVSMKTVRIMACLRLRHRRESKLPDAHAAAELQLAGPEAHRSAPRASLAVGSPHVYPFDFRSAGERSCRGAFARVLRRGSYQPVCR